MARDARVRDCDRPFLGLAGTYTQNDLYKISGKYIACPGCTRDDYELGNCHLTPILEGMGWPLCGILAISGARPCAAKMAKHCHARRSALEFGAQ